MYNGNPVNKILGNRQPFKPLKSINSLKPLKGHGYNREQILYVVEVSDHWNQPVVSEEWTTTLSPKEWLKEQRKKSKSDNNESGVEPGRWTTPYTYDTGETVLGFGHTKQEAKEKAEHRWYRGI